MAASRTALLLLGLVVLATMGAGAEAITPPAHTCKACPKDYRGLLCASLKLHIKLDVNLKRCLVPLRVLVGGVVGSGRGNALKVSVGGKVTVLGPLQVHLKVAGVLGVKVELLAKDGKTVVAKVALNVPVADAAVALVGNVYHLAVEVVYDAVTGELLFFTGNVHLHSLNVRAHLSVLGLVSLGAHVKLP